MAFVQGGVAEWRRVSRYRGEARACKLNGTDLKFFYEVNRETRKLIKRSSRANDLKEKFKVRERCRRYRLWKLRGRIGIINRCGRIGWDETYFCWKVAQTNKLELLKWAREEKKCEWDEGTINMAAQQGNLEMVKYCVANECPINMNACAYAAQGGHLEVLKYLHEEVKAKASLGLRVLPLGRLKMVIFIYSNILLSVSMINLTKLRVGMQP